jgi:N-acetylgalactosamine kinase
VAEFTARAERYVGVTSGGMDQAISIMGTSGSAAHVEFNPVRANPVALPPGATFVIANSMAVSNKAESATGRYNLRVVECRLAAAVLALALGAGREVALKVRTLKEVEPMAQEHHAGAANPGLAAAEALHPGSYTSAELEALLGVPPTALFQSDASALRVLGAHDAFKLRDRTAHVFSEKQRVLDFAAACADSGADTEAALRTLGQLMDDSQASCRDLYECSCSELDALVTIAKAAGAIGARLTGAGWGGCTVSLVRAGEEGEFINKVKEAYYRPLVEAGRTDEAGVEEAIFASKPASGGAVLRL